MSGQFGWSSYRPLPAAVPVDGASAKELRPGLADVGRLVRRGVRAVVGAARAGERPRLSLILGQHLGPEAGTFDVVEETWPGYDHVNVQAGLDAWLAEPGRTWELVGVANFQHTMFGLGDLVPPVPDRTTRWVSRRATPPPSTSPAVRTARSAPASGAGSTW